MTKFTQLGPSADEARRMELSYWIFIKLGPGDRWNIENRLIVSSPNRAG